MDFETKLRFFESEKIKNEQLLAENDRLESKIHEKDQKILKKKEKIRYLKSKKPKEIIKEVIIEKPAIHIKETPTPIVFVNFRIISLFIFMTG